MSGFQRVGIGSVQSYEDDDGYDPENNRGGYTKSRRSSCRKWCCAIFVLVLLGAVAGGAYVAYDKYLKPMWAESNESANGEAESGSGSSGNNETAPESESPKPDVPPPSPLVPPEPSKDLNIVCAADYMPNNDTSACIAACAQGACCFPLDVSEQSCYEIPGAAAICDMYLPCLDVIVGNESNTKDNMTESIPSPEEEFPKEEYPIIIGNATNNAGGTDFETEVPLSESPSFCGGLNEFGDEICFEGNVFCTTDAECEAQLGFEYGRCLETCAGEYSNVAEPEEEGPGGMLGFDGEAAETPSFCAAANGTCIGLVDCQENNLLCNTNEGEYCSVACGPEAGFSETNESETYYGESNFPPSDGEAVGMAAALYSICMPVEEVLNIEAIQSVCDGLSSDMNFNMCDPAVASEPGTCFCDSSIEESGCSDDQACTEPFCSLVSEELSFPNYCYTPAGAGTDFTCGVDTCENDLDCSDGELCSTDEVCGTQGICCSPV